MKVLLIDAGNTRLKWAVLDLGPIADGKQHQGRLGPFGHCCYDGEDIASLLAGHWSGLPDIARAILASVAGTTVNQQIQQALQLRWGVQAEQWLAAAEDAGIVNAYVEPQRLGVDRWLALVAARRLTTGAVCVVDCGTAVTIDRLDADGRHQGGLILPGMAMMLRALSVGTAGLSADAGAATTLPDNLWDGTAIARLEHESGAAVSGGVRTMLVAAIDRVVGETDREAGSSTHLITGGDGERLQPLLFGQWLSRPNLVLEGMATIIGDRA